MGGTKKTNKRTCNHLDCDLADQEFKTLYPKGKWLGSFLMFTASHCHDETCEEYFGY